MKNILSSIGAVAAAMLLSACFEMKSVVTVNKDGTGSIEETFLVSAQMKAMMSLGNQGNQGGQGGPNIKDLIPDQAKAEERAKKLGEGVSVKSIDPQKLPDGREGVKVTYAVKDINKLKYQPFDPKEGENSGSKPVTFALSGGTLNVSLPPDDVKKEKTEKPEIPAEQLQAQLAMMKPMFAGMRLASQIKVAGGIASSDASNVEGDTVTILDIQFDKLMEDPKAFSKFMETADDKSMTPAKAAEQFKGVAGIKIEGKEKLSIKLK